VKTSGKVILHACNENFHKKKAFLPVNNIEVNIKANFKDFQKISPFNWKYKRQALLNCAALLYCTGFEMQTPLLSKLQKKIQIRAQRRVSLKLHKEIGFPFDKTVVAQIHARFLHFREARIILFFPKSQQIHKEKS